MKKLGKILLKTILWILGVVLLLVLTLPLWFGPAVKTAANAIVPGKVGTDFHLGHIYLNPYTVCFELGDVQLANPQGYSEEYAFKLGDLAFDADTFSLMTDVIHIEEICVKDLFLSVVSGGENKVDNFKQIQYNVAGGKEQFEQAQSEKEAQAKLEELQTAETAQARREEPTPTEAEAEKPAKKVIIDHLLISGIRVQYGFLPIVVPFDIELRDIGKDSGGATFEEAWDAILAAVLKAAGAVGDQIKALGGLAGDAAGAAAEAAGKAASQATEAAGAAGEAASKALDSIKKLW